MMVLTPVDHIRGLTDIYIAEWGMSVIRRAGEHYELSVDLTREKHAVPVIRDEGIRQT